MATIHSKSSSKYQKGIVSINDLQEIELTLNKHWNVRLECEMTGMC